MAKNTKKTVDFKPSEPVVYTIHGRKLELVFDPDKCTGAQFDACSKTGIAVEQAILADNGYFSPLRLTYPEWAEFLSAIFKDVSVELWTPAHGKELEKWFGDHFPNPNLLEGIVQNFINANADWFGGSARLWKFKNRILELSLEGEAKKILQDLEKKLKKQAKKT
jgi:hypothetical protein